MNTTRHPIPEHHRRPALLLPILAILAVGLSLSHAVHAEWQVINETDAGGVETPIAEVSNDAGYRLAIYRDGNGTVRARFRLNDGLYRLDDSICPSYQIDERQVRNSSVNNRPCRLEPRLSEYVLGSIENNQVVSRPLYELMNGSQINYRFRLQAGGYDQASFSLAGSKRTLTAVLGVNLEVLPR